MAAILVVCTGNICRSPMAAGFLRRALERRFGAAAPEVRSAGTVVRAGEPASVGAVFAAAELGVDLSAHRAVPLTPGLVRGADVILAMAAEHREAVARLVPDAEGATFTLKELVRRLEALPAAEGLGPEALRARVQAAAARPDPAPGGPEDDVPDPLGGTLDGYLEVARDLRSLAERFVAATWGVDLSLEEEAAR
ncbi:MAG TPA: low molecular weight protein arginine phosphatase [Actinomycetota bacterium]|nr:low molecular weight protein arginine phosphatase [Actinomycetota bacterium]